MRESLTIEIHPFLNGGQIRVTHSKGRHTVVFARFMPNYEYKYSLDDLRKFVIPHLDFNKGKVWRERKLHREACSLSETS